MADRDSQQRLKLAASSACAGARWPSLVLLFTLLIPASAPGQGGRAPVGAAPSSPGWLPGSLTLESRGSGTPDTRADRPGALKRLHAAMEIVRKTNTARDPRGFEILPSFKWNVLISRSEPRNTFSYSVSLYIFVPTKAVASETLNAVNVIFNPYPDEFGNMLDQTSEKEWDIFLATPPMPPVHGFQATEAYAGGEAIVQVLFTPTGGRQPVRTASRGECLRWEIQKFEALRAKDTAAFREAANSSSYQKWVAEAPERRKQRETVIAALNATNPAQAAKVRAELEQTGREVTAKLKASEAGDRAEMRIAAAMPAVAETNRERLAAVTPAELAAPAWLYSDDRSRFVDPSTPYAPRLIRPVAEFYRAGPGLRSEARAILSRFCGVQKVRGIVKQILHEPHWGNLAALLDSPPER